MQWAEIRIHTTNEAVEPIANLIHEAGASGLVIEDPLDLHREHRDTFGEMYALNSDDYPQEGVYIKAYIPANSSLKETVDQISEAVSNLKQFGINIGKNNIKVSEIDEEDWATAWKKYYKPVKISEKITITPTWEKYKPASGEEVIIELDPGMAFGTGTHPTTMLSIQALEKYINKNDFIMDVGSGSGVLSIASALLGVKKANAYDLDDVAVKSTELNAQLNRMEKKISAQQNNLLENVNEQADIIVSNILAEIIITFTEDAWNNLKNGGLFITSGIIQSKKQLVVDKLQNEGFQILEINEMNDWLSIVAKKSIIGSGILGDK
ncbi:50S ribosomal protein L11 methyltransferase [Virgibacillus oceani]